MSASSVVNQPQPANPFQSQREYSAEAVELMRALSADRKDNRRRTSTPEQILHVVQSLGYHRPENSRRSFGAQSRDFVQTMNLLRQRTEPSFLTCDHLLTVLNELGYIRANDEAATIRDGLPVDRRRRENDCREQPTERRSNPEPGPQEIMDLTEDEHCFLDALKDLRQNTGRPFASSEELLSILWTLGYRPTSAQGVPVTWLDEGERCLTQMAFTQAIEQHLAAEEDSDYLTCRSLIHIAAELGFQKHG
ncbi:MAG: hypothetical protein R3C59_05140 [Planctomycetaceae bacterium]